MNVILILLGLTGITMIAVRGAVFYRLRDWLLAVRPNDVGYLANCPQCMGFWIGLFGGVVYADFLMVPLYAGAVSLLAVWADRQLLAQVR